MNNTDSRCMIVAAWFVTKLGAKKAFAVSSLLIMGGGGWHSKELDNEFNNLTMIKLPPYSPELNPIE